MSRLIGRRHALVVHGPAGRVFAPPRVPVVAQLLRLAAKQHDGPLGRLHQQLGIDRDLVLGLGARLRDRRCGQDAAQHQHSCAKPVLLAMCYSSLRSLDAMTDRNFNSKPTPTIVTWTPIACQEPCGKSTQIRILRLFRLLPLENCFSPSPNAGQQPIGRCPRRQRRRLGDDRAGVMVNSIGLRFTDPLGFVELGVIESVSE